MPSLCWSEWKGHHCPLCGQGLFIHCVPQASMPLTVSDEGRKERRKTKSQRRAWAGLLRVEVWGASRPAAGRCRVGGFLAAAWDRRTCPVEEGTRWQGEEISPVLAPLSTSSHSPYPHRRGCGPKGVCVRPGVSVDRAHRPVEGSCHCWLRAVGHLGPETQKLPPAG